MYMANHDIVLMAVIATPTNWTRNRGPFAVDYCHYISSVDNSSSNTLNNGNSSCQ